MNNKHGIQIIETDEKLFGLNDVRLAEAEDSLALRPDTISRFPILRDAFKRALSGK